MLHDQQNTSTCAQMRSYSVVCQFLECFNSLPPLIYLLDCFGRLIGALFSCDFSSTGGAAGGSYSMAHP